MKSIEKPEGRVSVDGLKVLIRGGGELASGVAHRLSQCHFRVCLTETPHPQAVRRGIAFCEAVYEGEKEIEGVVAKLVSSSDRIYEMWREGSLPLLVDPENKVRETINPDVLVDAIIAKKNLGTRLTDAPLVIGLGIGFIAGKDVHAVIETNRGHNLGRILRHGKAEADTGIPGEIAGFSVERVWHAPAGGRFSTPKRIGDQVAANEVVAFVDDQPVKTLIGGVIRGLLRDETEVYKGMKLGDIDPRGIGEYCYTISDKSRTIAGGVLETILSHFNQ
ncbi:MAG: molybdenum hydroxylase [Dehalococcoidales bacterium]|jgi:xanthine dehydrogenase accessory factor|nr:molybdenum hydroxylase [Dehalococcoidales bacterium]MDP6222119.1 selenium-dependent molybdenum cofactor biosynthesis protein YqeB [Dehalococcoidales bacterium]MDP7110273.1 selenium-dependent molybdenum cofactor biosynthesis protein YqeB [Dehalococcoidales bacterium]MDP7310341.1 selenium-dependent molybdenum cofactor biosynthesis protein YqeB [Dehalococcoidales bacterium]MDP7409957.1 selenium-dependent molybdenum cofactor biosynthesis protein YqeB [Dehalococcoidales bacterium]|tara:strand:- start:3 stop:833 length:831 start_codon:yes stop_codon:yes gene_type:complete